MAKASGGTAGPRWGAFSVLVVLGALAAAPGLTGSWVGDDFHMVSGPIYGDWGQVWRVFGRHSQHYIDGPGQDLAPGMAATYRPVTMFTLLVTHALEPLPWLHHLVSWLMHVGTATFLYLGLSGRSGTVDDTGGTWLPLFLAGLFLLHPFAVESYVWINGRSDLAAGFCLALLAFLFSRRWRTGVPRWALIALVIFLGAASKATFVPAALAFVIADGLRTGSRRAALFHGLVAAGGLIPFLAMRGLVVPWSGRLGASENFMTDPEAWAGMPQLFAMAMDTFLFFRAEAMRSLAWALAQPFSIGEWVGVGVLLAMLAGLALRRDAGGIVHVLGALASLAPCVLVSQSVWIGFDRYLYMPALLLAFAVLPHAQEVARGLPRVRLLGPAIAATLALVCLFGTAVASSNYANQRAYLQAMLDERPDDPTVHYFVAKIANSGGDSAAARARLDQMPAPPWPRGLIVPVLQLATELGQDRLRVVALEYGLTRYPDDAVLRALGMQLRYGQGRVAEAMELARTFTADEPLCTEVRRQLEIWGQSRNEEARALAAAAARDLQCGGRSSSFSSSDRSTNSAAD